MIRRFHTPDGVIERELTDQEIIDFAEAGDKEARLVLFKERYDTAASPGQLQEKVDIIAEYLGLKPEK